MHYYIMQYIVINIHIVILILVIDDMGFTHIVADLLCRKVGGCFFVLIQEKKYSCSYVRLRLVEETLP